jgi:hypothetical protein
MYILFYLLKLVITLNISVLILIIYLVPTQSVPEENYNILGGHSIDYSMEKLYMYMCSLPNGFRHRAISLDNQLIRIIYYALFPIAVHIMQVTNLVQFT